MKLKRLTLLVLLSLSGAAPAAPVGDPILIGAGDIAACNWGGAEATAKLLDGLPGTVFTTGDNAYERGTAAQFKNCYGPTWGRQLKRTRPSPGNHDFVTEGGAPYRAYFGSKAGPSGGYYSYDLGAWHIVSLNSNIAVREGSAQERWLRADLKAHPSTCTLAYWHHPRFSSGLHGSDSKMRDLWRALYDNNVDVILNGHDHDYERFAPQTPDGKHDATRGIRAFVIGTGGAGLRPFAQTRANSQVRNANTWGVLKLTLHASTFDWAFVPVAGASFTDAGRATCH